jgi:hypothetical protein
MNSKVKARRHHKQASIDHTGQATGMISNKKVCLLGSACSVAMFALNKEKGESYKTADANSLSI